MLTEFIDPKTNHKFFADSITRNVTKSDYVHQLASDMVTYINLSMHRKKKTILLCEFLITHFDKFGVFDYSIKDIHNYFAKKGINITEYIIQHTFYKLMFFGFMNIGRGCAFITDDYHYVIHPNKSTVTVLFSDCGKRPIFITYNIKDSTWSNLNNTVIRADFSHN